MRALFDVDKGESAEGLKYWGTCTGKATLLEQDYSPKFSHGLSSSSLSNFEISLDFLGSEERDTATMQQNSGGNEREDQRYCLSWLLMHSTFVLWRYTLGKECQLEQYANNMYHATGARHCFCNDGWDGVSRTVHDPDQLRLRRGVRVVFLSSC